MFARVLGPYLMIGCITAAARTSEMSAVLSDFAANALWPWVAGSVVLLGGLVVIALHSYWRGPAAIVVSVLGWLIALRGLLLLAFPAAFTSMAQSMIGMGDLWRAVCIVFAAMGLYLSYVGWMPPAGTASSRPADATRDLPQAA